MLAAGGAAGVRLPKLSVQKPVSQLRRQMSAVLAPCVVCSYVLKIELWPEPAIRSFQEDQAVIGGALDPPPCRSHQTVFAP